MTKEWGMGQVFILFGIHVITRGRVQWRRGWGGGGGSEHVKGKINHQLQKFTPLGFISSVTVLYFSPRAEREKRRGPMPLGLFLLFSVCYFFLIIRFIYTAPQAYGFKHIPCVNKVIFCLFFIHPVFIFHWSSQTTMQRFCSIYM